MKKFIIILTIFLISNNVFSQHSKGDLLLESQFNGAWSSLALSDNTVFGLYISDNFALIMGTSIGLVENSELSLKLGGRYHLNNNSIVFSDLHYDDYTQNLNINLGISNRFFANDWLAFEPKVGIEYQGLAITFKSSVGVCVFFSKD